MKQSALDAQSRQAAVSDLCGAGWSDCLPDRDAISKTFRFANFNDAFGWMTRVAMVAEQTNHHPEWSNIYNRVHVTLTTHDVGGLSVKDIDMARIMDKFAR
jgi:4a-hydroxytetrahydrobiopterin dehydratase